MAFRRAVSQGDEEAVSRLLDADPTLLEAGIIHGFRPLAWAARHGQLGVVRLLVQRGANIDPPGNFFFTALNLAGDHGHEEVLAFLLENGAQARRSSASGMTVLMSASDSGHVGVVRMLCEHLRGQGLDHRDECEQTALHYAVRCGHTEVVKLLLFAGADHTIRDHDEMMPRALAEEKRDEADQEEQTRTRYATCVAVFEWWEGELKRRPLLERARCLHDASTTQRDAPAAPVPAFLQARAAAGQALPQVEVVATQQEEQQQQAGASGKREASSEAGRTQEEEERHAVCGYVVGQLNEELFKELVQGFHSSRLV